MKKSLTATLLGSILLASTSHAALTTGLVAYLDFEDLENSPEASFPLDATATGTFPGVGTPGGQSGNGVEFDGGVGDFINLGLSFGPGGTSLGQSFTLSAWYRLENPPSSPSNRHFVFEGATDFGVSYGLRNFGAADGLIDGQTFTTAGTPRDATYANVHLTTTWQHVLQRYTFDGETTNTDIETFIDGVSRGIVTNTGTISDTGIHIGNARNSNNRGFDGMIDEFGAWDRVLTDQEVENAFVLGTSGQALTDPIPEPSSVLLIVLGLSGFAARRMR